MREKKTILVVIAILVLLITIINIPKLFLNKKEEILPEVKLKEIEKSKSFAIMVPNEKGNGYTTYNKNEWPTSDDDYYYVKSECIDNTGKIVENAISYNEENNTASLTTNSTVYCTLYFDKYNYMKVPTHKVTYDDAGNTIWVPDYMSSKVKKVEFVDNLPNLENLTQGENYWDISDTSQGTKARSVIVWIEPIEGDTSYDTLYIGSKTKIRATSLAFAFTASGYDNALANPITNLKNINFNDRLDTSKTINMMCMLLGCKEIRNFDFLQNLDVSKVETMEGMVQYCSGLTNLDFLSKWQTSSLKSMINIFAVCLNLTDISGISKWDTSKVTDMYCVFNQCSNLQNINAIQNWQTENVQRMHGLLRLTNISDVNALKEWNVSKVTNMQDMFGSCKNLENINGISEWQTLNLENMKSMFSNCEKLKSVDVLDDWNVSNVTDMSGTFVNCKNLVDINLNNWNTPKLNNMKDMFSTCSNLNDVQLNKLDTTNVTDMEYLFWSCTNLNNIEMGNAIFNNVTIYNNMFTGVPQSATILVKDADQQDWIQNTAGFKGTINVV